MLSYFICGFFLIIPMAFPYVGQFFNCPIYLYLSVSVYCEHFCDSVITDEDSWKGIIIFHGMHRHGI
jgi:hypothetical protein